MYYAICYNYTKSSERAEVAMYSISKLFVSLYPE
jgi:hypothetical protein